MNSEMLDDSPIYSRLINASEADAAVQELSVLVREVVEACVNVTKATVVHMPEYTLHDEVHIANILSLMSRLIPENVLDGLQPLELAGLLLAGALHDVGMALSTEEAGWLMKGAEGEAVSENQLRYGAHRQSFPQLLRRQAELRNSRQFAEAHQVEAYMTSAYVRKTHGDRCRTFVFDRYGDRLRYKDFKFASRIADVCFSHTVDTSYLRDLPCRELVRAPAGYGTSAEYTNWRFLAAILRLADIMDFDGERTPEVLFDHLGIRSEVSVQEWRKHRSINAWDIEPGRVVYGAQCSDPVLEKCVRDFIKLVDREMSATKAIISDMHDPAEPDLSKRYRLNLADAVDTQHIRAVEGPEGPAYQYVDLKFYLDEEGIKSLLLGISLYADRTLFLRELLQNALDACRHRSALHAADPGLGKYEPEIRVTLLEEDGHEFVEVEDNGMGMDHEIVRFHFARIGASYYKSSRFFEESAKQGLKVKPISQFGIGILSVFMVADSMEVKTLRLGSAAEAISLEIANEGALFSFRKGDRQRPGTLVRLRLSEPWSVLADGDKRSRTKRDRGRSLRAKVRELVPHSRIPILAGSAGNFRREANRWEPPALGQMREWRDYEIVEINLTRNAPEGLDGVARVIILTDSIGSFACDVRLPYVDDDDDVGGYDLRDTIAHDFRQGEIEHVFRDFGSKDGYTEGYASEVISAGRWSQQDILVPDELIASGFESHVKFPLPVLYDLNLDGEFTLPISVDRKSVVRRPEARRVLDRIAEELMRLTIDALGTATLHANRNYFEKMVIGREDWPGMREVTEALGGFKLPESPPS